MLTLKRTFFVAITFILAVNMLFFSAGKVVAQHAKPFVRIARLQIDSSQLERYKAALKEGAETAVRAEPGVISLYAVYEKDHPTRVTVFEIYSSAEAYKSHIETAHFKKYKDTTKDMVKSLELIDAIPIALATKNR